MFVDASALELMTSTIPALSVNVVIAVLTGDDVPDALFVASGACCLTFPSVTAPIADGPGDRAYVTTISPLGVDEPNCRSHISTLFWPPEWVNVPLLDSDTPLWVTLDTVVAGFLSQATMTVSILFVPAGTT
jgi:hypothetical protein